MHSLLLTAVLLGSKIRIATPKGYGPKPDILADAREIAKQTGAIIELMTDPCKAVRDADAVYTDAWISMGHEHEGDQRAKIFPPYQVNAELMAIAAPRIFMHCLAFAMRKLPMMMDSLAIHRLRSAENRMQRAKAVLVMPGGNGRLPLRSARLKSSARLPGGLDTSMFIPYKENIPGDVIARSLMSVGDDLDAVIEKDYKAPARLWSNLRNSDPIRLSSAESRSRVRAQILAWHPLARPVIARQQVEVVNARCNRNAHGCTGKA
jgi:hypothetical protein